MSYSEFEDALLVAAYLVTEETGEDYLRVREVVEKYPMEFKNHWVMRALQAYIDHGYSDDGRHLGGDPLDQSLSLTSQGFREAERLIEGGVTLTKREELPEGVVKLRQGNVYTYETEVPPNFGGPGDIFLKLEAGDKAADDAVPASDRLVRLDHNAPEFRQVDERLGELHEVVRTSNDLPIESEERDRILVSLESARALWSAAQLKVIQVKVGIIMAIEDVQKALATTAKAVMAALLIDAVKSLIKSHTGIDLDHL